MKRVNVGVVLFLIILIALTLYRSHFSKNTSNKVVTVIINDEGFSPDRITILKGATVIWENRGEHLHWPASNFHPTHTLYPESGGCLGSKLDACRGLQREETFSFKLNRVGIWSIHDHLFPGLVMVVEVVNKLSTNNQEILSENGIVSSNEFQKLNYGKQTEIIKSMAGDDPSLAWAYIKHNFIVNGQVISNAHEFAHIIGNQSYKKFGINGVKICDDNFAFGCFHGVTEAMLLEKSVKSVKSIELECLELFPTDKSQNYRGCIHGSGHGLYGFEGGNIKKALTDCDIISEPYRQYCYDGVFMENSSTPENRIFDNENPWKFCADLEERYHRNCARYQSQVFLSEFKTPNSLNLAGKNCALGPSVLLREICFQGLGFRVAQSNLGKLTDIFKNCEKMPSTEGREMCIVGAAQENIFQKYVDYKNSANKLCESLKEPKRSVCFSNIDRMLK